MRIPLKWLQQYVNVQASGQEVGTKLTMGGLEVEGIEESALGPVLDVYVTPNRGDCLSLLGVAREVSALYDLPLTLPTPPQSEQGGDVAGQTSVTIEDPNLCPRYAARIVRGVKVGSSPAWMQARLEAAGQRPINNIVDVTNYVMLELGQPLHAFDLRKLAGERIVVRRARDGETIKTLDGEERTLSANTLVIADAEKPVAVAGVMGGADSEVDANSVDILIESAHFDPLAIRRASRLLKLRTEASYRFERVVDIDGVQRAVDRACELLADMGQTGVVPGIVDVYPQPHKPRLLTLRVARTAELLGMDITMQAATYSLIRLGFAVGPRVDSDTLNVEVPSFRPDITLEEDLIEEVGRIYGYENIPETLPRGFTTQGGDSPDGLFIDRVKHILASAGLQEVVTHSLTAPAFFDSPDDASRRVSVRNALSAEVGGLRRSLLPTLLDVARHNAAYQQANMALFEVGRVWQMQAVPVEDGGSGEPVPTEYIAVGGLLVGSLEPGDWHNKGKGASADFYTIRGIVEQLTANLGMANVTFAPLGDKAAALPLLHPGRSAMVTRNESQVIGIVGELHPRAAQQADLRDKIYVFELSYDALKQEGDTASSPYHALPRFPAVTRDLAPRLGAEIPFQQVQAAVESVTVPLLESMRLTDVFEGAPVPEGQKSLTLSFTFRAPDRTLNEAEVSAALLQAKHALETHCAATFVG